jgi:NAD(P)-dependent dehydrogenase (short-subunit alcohol dehydrogenase family)
VGRLDGSVAIVTGGGSGIGREIALGYAREGARVLVADRDEEAAGRVAAEAPDSLQAHRADVTVSEDVQAMVRAAVERFGKLDVLVNNAAVQLVGRDGRCHEVSEDVWDRTMAVNLRGPYLCAKYAIAEMLRAGTGGIIVNLASPTAHQSLGAGYAAYASSKGGVTTLTRVIAADYGRDGIRCNAIVPGATETPLTAEIFADRAVREGFEARVPLGRLGRPEDLVGIAIFLASEEARYATGALFFVDGGLTMH